MWVRQARSHAESAASRALHASAITAAAAAVVCFLIVPSIGQSASRSRPRLLLPRRQMAPRSGRIAEILLQLVARVQVEMLLVRDGLREVFGIGHREAQRQAAAVGAERVALDGRLLSARVDAGAVAPANARELRSLDHELAV